MKTVLNNPPARGAFENVGRCARLARRASFSSAHFYAQPKFTDAQNREVFGTCYSEHGHGHGYILEAYYLGHIQADSGLVINLVDVDTALRECVAPFEHKHLNHDVPFFKDVVPTTENIARRCFEALSTQTLPGVALEAVRIFENDDLWADWSDSMTQSSPWGAWINAAPLAIEATPSLTLQMAVPAMHSLANPSLSAVENEALYGPCYRLHGHDYRVQATFEGSSVDPATGMALDREVLARALETSVVEPNRGRNLNNIYLNASCESLACSWFDALDAAVRNAPLRQPAILARLAIQETSKNWFARDRRMAELDIT